MRPLIAITPDLGRTDALPARPALPRLELKRAYTEAVARAGGLPLVIPPTTDLGVVLDLFARCDGLVITGGAFDIPPELYGEERREGLGVLKLERTGFELALASKALERDIPVLGVCGGMQLLAVALKAPLVQDIGREIPGALQHEQTNDPSQPSHSVTVAPGTLLARATGVEELQVNSTHHQAVHRLPAGIVASARAPDGVVEAIEVPERAFVLGVQWHPELLAAPEHAALYRALVEAARGRR